MAASPGERASGPDFVRALLGELAAGRYRSVAWRRFLVRSWNRSLEDLRAAPRRTRSCLGWCLAGALLGGGALLGARAAAPADPWLHRGLLWALWYLGVAGYALLHLGMVETAAGSPARGFLFPNGLTLLRLGLAPLASQVLPAMPSGSRTGALAAVGLGLLAATDFLDGQLARARGQSTRFGRMLDPLADMAFLVALALGLNRAGLVPPSLLVLLGLRYHGALVAGLVLYFARGPFTIQPTTIGKLSGLLTSVVLVGAAAAALAQPAWLPRAWVAWSVWLLHVPVGLNLAYLAWRGVRG